ncbi:kinase-like protein [Athelia psychrophila]|uniref:Kinase-like protein n=1 Tax=Athelia psychrophila TaxID=1759441 RepID=A0A165XMH1_9AGAM|nr:kinase-like protein [Fibularhizoctonia sp. CBS 109695]
MLSPPTVVFNTPNAAGNAQINNVNGNYNIVYQVTPDQGVCGWITSSCLRLAWLTTTWKVFKRIQDSIERVKESQQQFGLLGWTIEKLLRIEDAGSVPAFSGPKSTSSTIKNLQKLLEEIHDFVEAEVQESFVKSLLTKEYRIAKIDAYQKRIATLANKLQISALSDVAKWQTKNDAAKVEDRNVLYARLDELEKDRELLGKTLEAHQEGVAVMVAFQARLEHQLCGDRERQFFTTSVTYLQTASGRSVKMQDWMVSSLDVQFRRTIVSGGFGEILLGRWHHMDVALKVLKTANGITPTSMLLEAEINIWSKLQHPHIISFLGANVWGNRPFIVMPYLKNGNARDYIQKYPERNRAAILHQAALGLLYLHSVNIIHADLKGYNILIDDSGKAVLCDFGLSRVKNDINSQSIIVSDEEIHGTINWMAPERLLGRSLRKPSDIYSFGMTIYEIFMDNIPLAGVQRVNFTQLVARENIRPEKPTAEDNVPHFTDEIWTARERDLQVPGIHG